MIFRILALALFLAVWSLPANSQLPAKWCGTTQVQAIKDQMLQNRRDMQGFVFPRNAVTYVPVRFILVAKSDGSGRPSEKLALKALCNLNEAYLDQDIQFYLKEFTYYNSTTVYSNPMSFGASTAIKNQMKYNAINVFVVNQASDAAAYYQPPAGPGGNDWIVCTSSYLDDVRVLAHEVGHFFSLPHPFHGWESSGGWDPNIHGNPVGLLAPDNHTPNEFVNGSNCQIAGDGICDTPADYMFPSGNCTYSGNAMDPNGELLQPDKENIMNYHFGCSSYHFSEDQKDEIKNSLFHSTRNYVRPNYVPNTAEVTTTPTILRPSNNETVATYDHVELEWSEVPGADRYLVEIFSGAQGTMTYLVDSNRLLLTNLLPNTGYIWKVMAFNEYHTCGNFASQKIFKTGNSIFTDTVEDLGIRQWSVSPNPVPGGMPLTIQVNATEGVEVEIIVSSLTGQQIHRSNGIRLGPGETSVEVPVDNLPAGVYLATLMMKNGRDTKRFVVTY